MHLVDLVTGPLRRNRPGEGFGDHIVGGAVSQQAAHIGLVADEREIGHTGAYFNYLWAPLGAAMGGEEAASAHFDRIKWRLDLNRNWDGGFDYDCLNGEGPDSGSEYNNFRMSTAALLTYALPLRQLHLTGRGQNPAQPSLTSTDVSEALTANDYDASSRSKSELISDLGSWSPKVWNAAAAELATLSLSSADITQITALANDTNGDSRAGACKALGEKTITAIVVRARQH